MMRLLSWLAASAVFVLIALVALAFLAVEDTPLVPQGEGLSPAAIARAKDILRKNDPRKLARNETRQVRITGPDLEALLNLAATRGLHGNAALELRHGGAQLHFSARLPASPLGRFLNLSADINADQDQLDVSAAAIGRVPLPAPVFRVLLGAALRHTDLGTEFELVKHTVSRVAITPDDVRITYVWQPEILDTARAMVISPAQRERLAIAHKRLIAKMDAVGQGGKAPLASVLGPLLTEAAESAPTAAERSLAYRDALLVTAFQLSGNNIAQLIPEARQWPRPRPLTLTLRGREDLAQHYTVSAALAAWAGESIANAIGVNKEVDDSKKGSGFSFIDLTADRAGTRLGELAARNPERLAAALAAGLTDTALLPSIDGLPEFMMSEEFQRRFGGVGAPAYTRMADEIERRVAALALFR